MKLTNMKIMNPEFGSAILKTIAKIGIITAQE